MNGQAPRPKTWKEWKEYLQNAVKHCEVDLELLKAQLKVAEVHTRGS